MALHIDVLERHNKGNKKINFKTSETIPEQRSLEINISYCHSITLQHTNTEGAKELLGTANLIHNHSKDTHTEGTKDLLGTAT